MRPRTIARLVLVLLVLALPAPAALAWPGKVVGVADGDTLTVLR